MRRSLALLCVCGFTLQTLAAPGYQPIGSGSYGGMSRNGKYVALYQTNGDVYRWSAATGQVSMGFNIGTGDVAGISDDGTIVIGTHKNASSITTAFRWTAPTGFVDLGDLPGGSTFSTPFAMSADGNVIVGDSASAASGTRTEAFRWTPATGIVALGDLPGGNYTSDATSVSADGSIIVGISNQLLGYEAYRWTSPTGMVGLGDIPGGPFNSQAYHISSNGQTIIGYNSDSLSREQAFRWTSNDGLVPLGFGTANPDEWSQAHGLSNDGNVIVGDNNTGVTVVDNRALIWDPAHGMRWLETALHDDYAVTLPAGVHLNYAVDVADDGHTIGGASYNPSFVPSPWVVTVVPEPTLVGALGFLGLLILRRGKRLTRRLHL